MTVITYRDGVLASDSGAFMGEAIVGAVVKIGRTRRGSLFGVAGDAGKNSLVRAFVEALEAGENPWASADDWGEAVSLIVLPSGRFAVVCRENPIFEPIRAPFAAIGAAQEMAFGAMAAGADAAQAVRICIRHHTGAVGPIQTRRLTQKPKGAKNGANSGRRNGPRER